MLTAIIQLNLPPTSYVLHASGDLVNLGILRLDPMPDRGGRTHVAGVSTLVGDPARPGAGAGPNQSATTRPQPIPGGAKSKYNRGARSG